MELEKTSHTHTAFVMFCCSKLPSNAFGRDRGVIGGGSFGAIEDLPGQVSGPGRLARLRYDPPIAHPPDRKALVISLSSHARSPGLPVGLAAVRVLPEGEPLARSRFAAPSGVSWPFPFPFCPCAGGGGALLASGSLACLARGLRCGLVLACLELLLAGWRCPRGRAGLGVFACVVPYLPVLAHLPPPRFCFLLSSSSLATRAGSAVLHRISPSTHRYRLQNQHHRVRSDGDKTITASRSTHTLIHALYWPILFVVVVLQQTATLEALPDVPQLASDWPVHLEMHQLQH